jgi:hypothetical protein
MDNHSGLRRREVVLWYEREMHSEGELNDRISQHWEDISLAG